MLGGQQIRVAVIGRVRGAFCRDGGGVLIHQRLEVAVSVAPSGTTPFGGRRPVRVGEVSHREGRQIGQVGIGRA